MKKTAVSVMVISFFCVGLYLSYGAGFWRMNHPDFVEFSVHGLDVSHHQGAIDWSKIPKDKYKFVYIKATEGGDHVDTRFDENWRTAKAVGMDVGAYHFFTLCRSGEDQADNFIKTVPMDMTLAPVIDLEYVGNCSKRPSKADFTRDLAIYIEKIASHYEVEPVLYTTYAFRRDYLGGVFDSYPLWIRDVWGRPKMSGWHIWQYADNARVQGISGPVDLNVMAD